MNRLYFEYWWGAIEERQHFTLKWDFDTEEEARTFMETMFDVYNSVKTQMGVDVSLLLLHHSALTLEYDPKTGDSLGIAQWGII